MKLAATSLVVQRGEKRVIDGLSFEVSGGESLLVIGPNGAGKTTLLRALAGLMGPTSGTIQYDGGDPQRTLAEQCHYLGHLSSVKSSLTISENLAFWASYLGNCPSSSHKEARRVTPTSLENAVDAFSLASLADAPVRYLSAGQRRRVGLARLLAVRRPVWLLDEPTAALDEASSGLLIQAIDAHTSAGGIAVIATHLPLALARANHVAL